MPDWNRFEELMLKVYEQLDEGDRRRFLSTKVDKPPGVPASAPAAEVDRYLSWLEREGA